MSDKMIDVDAVKALQLSFIEWAFIVIAAPIWVPTLMIVWVWQHLEDAALVLRKKEKETSE